MYKHILIATDGSDLADIAVAQGLALAKQIGAIPTTVQVPEVPQAFLTGLVDAMITNAVRCAPPANKPTPQEEQTCRSFLRARMG
jgi:nucleotide-binding universal stress UspA family protein